MRSLALYLVMAAIALSASCSEDHQNLPTSFAYDPPPTPVDLIATGGEESSTIRWSYPAEARPSVLEFRVYQYIELYDMVQLVGTTADTVFIDSLLVGNLVYCYKVSAVDMTGFEGWRTASACALVRTRSREKEARVQ